MAALASKKWQLNHRKPVLKNSLKQVQGKPGEPQKDRRLHHVNQ